MRSLLAVSLLAVFFSCKKDRVNEPKPVVPPAMTIVNLHDTAVVFNRGAYFDVNADGYKDI